MTKKTNKDPNKNLMETLNEMEVIKEPKKTNKKTVSKTSKKVAAIIQEEIEIKFKFSSYIVSFPLSVGEYIFMFISDGISSFSIVGNSIHCLQRI